MRWYGPGMGGGGIVVMTAIMVVFLVLVIGAIVAALVYLTRSRPHLPMRAASDGMPEQILAARYARGEIDDTEYRQRLDTLRGIARSGQM